MQKCDARNIMLKYDGNLFPKYISMPPKAKEDICLIP